MDHHERGVGALLRDIGDDYGHVQVRHRGSEAIQGPADYHGPQLMQSHGLSALPDPCSYQRASHFTSAPSRSDAYHSAPAHYFNFDNHGESVSRSKRVNQRCFSDRTLRGGPEDGPEWRKSSCININPTRRVSLPGHTAPCAHLPAFEQKPLHRQHPRDGLRSLTALKTPADLC